MTKAAALQNFFSGFGMYAYPTTAVPSGAELPYLTYDPVFDSWEGGEVGITVKLWFYTESEAVPNAKAQELSEAIGRGGKVIPCDGGFIWLKRGSPWCRNITDDIDRNIKCRDINVTADYLTAN